VDLLVVIAIIGILVGLLLSTVQVDREEARPTACVNLKFGRPSLLRLDDGDVLKGA